jgi:multidrug efflux pump
MFSKFFINRPVFASVLSIVIVLFGLISMMSLPVAQYPEILPPEVMVQASYPGATAEVIATTVASPLEQSINGVDNMLYITSTSSDAGSLMLDISFKVGSDPDQNTINVNNRVQTALSQLPASVRSLGVTVSKRSSSIMGVGSVYSPNGQYDTTFLSNYAILNVIDELKRTPGVGDAYVFGKFNYAIRVWLNPDKLAQYGLTTTDVSNAITEQNSQFAAGSIGADPSDGKGAFTYAVTTQGRLVTPREFGNIILRSDSKGSVLRLSDVARIELGAQGYGLSGTMNGLPAANIGIFLQPGANAVATSKAVNATMSRLEKNFPAGVAFKIPFDTTRFVSVAIDEVIKTFVAALCLVLLVVYLFLQNFRATIIPMIAVPVSIIGTFAGMAMLGFTINMMTLFGLILAIGIVVDDAIVVLENTERIMREKGLTSHEAAIESMNEVTTPVVAIVLVLCAVFVPVAFIQGLSGAMYKQFAITIAISVVISGFCALTLTPALCAIMLKDAKEEKKPGRFFSAFNKYFDKFREAYLHGARYFYGHNAIGIGVFLGVIILSGLIWMRIPTSLVPEEDQGYLMSLQYLPPGASLSRTNAVAEPYANMVISHPGVSDIVSIAGLDMATFSMRTNSGAAFINLKDWSERKSKALYAPNIAGQLTGMGMQAFPDALVFAVNAPPISGLSTTGGFSGFVQNYGNATPSEVGAVTQKFMVEAGKRPELTGMRSSFSAMSPRYNVSVDRERARAMGVKIDEIFNTMASTFGQNYVNDFTLYGRNYQVDVESESSFRNSPEGLRNVYVKSSSGDMVPLYSLVTFNRTVGADIVQRFNLFTSAPFDGQPAEGYSSGQALKAIEQVAKETLPAGYGIAWTGQAYQEKAVGNTSTIVFVFGIIMVFLILAAQYERWSLPFAVITAIPFGLFGALLMVWIRGMENNIYFQISLLVMIGLAAKNAILIVEFAVQLRDKGMTRRDAAIEAAKLRFRPIIMTSMAFILGCLPLAFSSGAGAASRESIGTGVVGGMLAATFIAIFFVPMFYRLIDRMGYKNPDALPVHTNVEGTTHE